ncbi:MULTISPECIES: hypothetical protein [Weeksella]|uniref:50S ribosomal protein L27 n=1 Tax=Weeksella virosa (strain ATCC 43766 / DSM 16922 / JCM 21250 / CCUG 30538 / CDC 9751 / IAM 14551 / NBRC 16016 / NCTC 11634 / CL345/78) TaxID=865938 RepID=F0NXH2_WEEVC|nr:MULTISPECIES: hypothetical protein [Weeksella]ADX67962.1 hypothetical protein Weevi_1258 [Weeksella virosa DSM 16922]MDK7374268.1 hypothetical protein [Weeksella virosa]MDK7674571.1 hypothetical protein [Weeksella virosa]OFM86125.1 hypothetical protein HMPREF2660_06310 [Weeksella sp. HMSC059D05]SUP54270.1 Uncharacterised protein [Weeksella virosa]
MDFIKQLHSGWAYLVLLMGVVFLVSTLVYAISKKPTDNAIRKISLITTIVFHVQLLVGFVTFFITGRYKLFADMGSVMKDEVTRLLTVEHPMMMIAGIIFMTIANAKLKRSSTVGFNVVLLALIALVVIVSRIPWQLWHG